MAPSVDLPNGLTEDHRKWIDWRMDWLCQEFGDSVLRDAEVVLSNDQKFQLKTRSRSRSHNESALERQVRTNEWFNRIAQRMELDANRVQLAFENEVDYEGKDAQRFRKRAAKYEIGLAEHELQNRTSLIALLAHEASYIRLVREERLEDSTSDADQVCDLATIFWGLGVFSANASVREGEEPSSHDAGYQSFLSPTVFGYALALFSYLRGETKPFWTTELRGDVRQAFLESQTYLDTYGTTDTREYESDPSNELHLVAPSGRDHRSDSSTEASQASQTSRGFADIEQYDDPYLDESHTETAAKKEPKEDYDEYHKGSFDSHPPEPRTSRDNAYETNARNSRHSKSLTRESRSPRDGSPFAEDTDEYLDPDEYSGEGFDDPEEVHSDHATRRNSSITNDESHNNFAPPYSGAGACVSCGQPVSRGHRLCESCDGTEEGRRAALRAELAQHDEKIWGVHFMFLVAVITLILIVVAAVNTSY